MKKRIQNILTKTPLFIRVVSLYVFMGSVAGIYFHVAPAVQAAPTVMEIEQQYSVQVIEEPVKPEQVSGIPKRIELPRIGLAHEVIDGDYDVLTQGWTLSDDKTHYATMTAPVNDQSGQTVIYGHNTSRVLEPVRGVEQGDELLVSADNGRTFVYTYTQDKFVVPTDASVIYETPDTPRVVLMTCEGWFSETRRLLYFDFKEVR